MNARDADRSKPRPLLPALALIALTAWLAPAAAGEWTAIDPPPGFSPDRWRPLAARLEERAYAMSDVGPILARISEAQREGLPVSHIINRLEEGVVKHVPAPTLQEGIQKRLEALRAARALLREAGYPPWESPPLLGLLISTANAIESDVAVAALRDTLGVAGGSRAMRIKFAIEAGESFKLLGLDPRTVALLMRDLAERDLSCGEIQRAIRFVTQQFRAGFHGDRIRDQLWNSGGPGPAPAPPQTIP